MSIRNAEMQYCNKCRRPLNDGEVCGCIHSAPQKKKSYTLLFAIGIPVLCLAAFAAAVLLLRVITDMSWRSKQGRMADMNKVAEEMTEAADKALQKISSEGGDVSGWNNINSDEDIPISYKFDIGRFHEYFSEYTGSSDKEFFIIAHDGRVEYLAVSDSWSNTADAVGIYPSFDDSPVYFSRDDIKEKVGKGKRLRDVYIEGTRELMDIRYRE
ncbi:hypothetical protein [Ruminococcus flavefaciens]|nr:hypothetical protein [Ruminococcus flavefaciens]